MFLIARRQSLFHLINMLFNLFANIHSVPINDLSMAQPMDSIYNQLIHGQNLIIHEERGVVFSRLGYYYEVDDIFGLIVTVPVTQYLCSILPIEQVEKLSLCVDYQERLHDEIEHEEISNHRSKRSIPIIIGAVAGALGFLLRGGITIFNTIKGAQLNNRVSEIQRSVSDTNKQLHSLEVSVMTNTNSTIQLARSFNNAQENMETMRTNMENIVKHISRFDSFAEVQTRYNLKTHAEGMYERMKDSIRRIEHNDLNLDFVGMTEQNEILEIAYEHLKYSVPSSKESKATFVSRMLFAQTVQFFPSENGTHTNDTAGYYPEYLGNIVFTSYFSVLKTNAYDKMQIYKLVALPFFTVEKEIGKELSGLPKIIGMSNGGYIEWQEIAEQQVCDFGDYTVCRDPPIVQKRLNNMCLEQLISTNRTFHCHVHDSLYSSPHFEKINSDIMALSTRTPINCVINRGFHIFKNLSIIHLGCNENFYCEGNLSFIGDKRCQMMKPYILKTINDDIVSVVESIRPLQEKNMKETEKTSDNLWKEGVINATRPVVIFLSVALSVVLIIVVLLVLCQIHRCCHNSPTQQSPIINTGTTMNEPKTSILPTSQDNWGSLHDLLQAFAINKLAKT